MIFQGFGSKRTQDQLPSIIQGFFEHFEWELASMENPYTDLIYANDPGGYDDAIEYQEKFGGKLILTVLDIPVHLFPNVDLEGLKTKLSRADAICSISKTTQKDVKEYFGIDSTVIYNPAKTVFEVPEIYKQTPFLKFLNCSRRSDPNKRYNIIIELLEKYYNVDQLLNIGPDPTYVGKFAGLVENKYLIAYYNHCDYMLIATKNGGIELQIPEALICGKKLVVANDCECSMEFAPEFAAEPTADGFYNKIQEIEANPEKYSEIIKKYQKRYSEQFHYSTIVENIIEVYQKTL